jgi:hypothetical protein
VLRADERGQLGHDQARHGLEVALALEHAGEAGHVRVQPVLLVVDACGLGEVVDHLVDGVLQLCDLPFGLDGDRAGQVALRHGL